MRLLFITAAVFGLIMIGLTFVASQLGGVLQAALALFGMIGGPLLGVFTLGVLFPWANWKGAISGLLTGLILTFWIGIGAQIYKPVVWTAPVSVAGCYPVNSSLVNLTTTAASMSSSVSDMTTMMTTTMPAYEPPLNGLYNLSYLWYSGFGVLVVVVVGMLVSAITGFTDTTMLDYRLICPIFDIMFCCFPKSCLRALRCGVGHDLEKLHYCCLCKDVDKEDFHPDPITSFGVPEEEHKHHNGIDNPAVEKETEEYGTGNKNGHVYDLEHQQNGNVDGVQLKQFTRL